MKESKKKQLCPALKLALCATLISSMLCGCSKVNDTPSDGADSAKATGSAQTDTQSPTAEKEPTTLEQELLKLRGIDFDKSDYKKFIGGENITDEHRKMLAYYLAYFRENRKTLLDGRLRAEGSLFERTAHGVLVGGVGEREPVRLGHSVGRSAPRAASLGGASRRAHQ